MTLFLRSPMRGAHTARLRGYPLGNQRIRRAFFCMRIRHRRSDLFLHLHDRDNHLDDSHS